MYNIFYENIYFCDTLWFLKSSRGPGEERKMYMVYLSEQVYRHKETPQNLGPGKKLFRSVVRHIFKTKTSQNNNI